jgi:hypothetical protein
MHSLTFRTFANECDQGKPGTTSLAIGLQTTIWDKLIFYRTSMGAKNKLNKLSTF